MPASKAVTIKLYTDVHCPYAYLLPCRLQGENQGGNAGAKHLSWWVTSISPGRDRRLRHRARG